MTETQELATQAAQALMPSEKLEAVNNLDTIVVQSAAAIQGASKLSRAFITSQAVLAVEDAITDDLMKDILRLMDSPLGFKTDRKFGTTKMVDGKKVEVQPYSKTVVKKIVIVALLAGAQLTGNEFNIIAGGFYPTKELMLKTIHSWPGLSRFKHQIGPAAQHGAKSAIMDGSAEWTINGEIFTEECLKVDGGMDNRIVVNAHKTSGPDQLRGLGESKLFRRVVARLTGLNFDQEEPIDGTATVDGQIVEPDRIAPSTDSESPAQDSDQPLLANDKPDSQESSTAFVAADNYLAAATEEIDQQQTIKAASKVASTRIHEMTEVMVDWPADLLKHVEGAINDAKKKRCDEIRNS